MDGEILDEPLTTIGRSRSWLKTELEKQGVTIENVFLGQVDSYGQLTIDLFDDKLQVPSPQEKPLILSTMKKCQANLELFALGTEAKEAKHMYSKNSKKLQEAIDKVTPILRG
jgi:23S rRNA G2069 N7-methylase RlmK/C1962 C5-methylase RlmI